MRLATYIDTDGFGAVGSFMRFGLNSRIGGSLVVRTSSRV